MDEITRVSNVSAETKNAISRKSAQTLPTHPSEMGYSAQEIKKRFYQPILDAANSALAEIDRVVNEVNKNIETIYENLREYVDNSNIKDSYKLVLNEQNWEYNNETSLYEITISSSQHGISDVKEIGVDMFLLDNENKYIPVNNYEVLPNGNIKCYHETNGSGYVTIFVKRDGFITGNFAASVEDVRGLAEVAKTNKYSDLDGKPDLKSLEINERNISNIIQGGIKVGNAVHADDADRADYASSSGSTDFATNASHADKSSADEYGVNLSNNYAKQNGNYAQLKAGYAERAKNDEDGVSLKNNYAKQNGNYQNMTVGKATNATNADKATKADSATKATQDGNGLNITTSYAKVNGTYSNMTVGKAKNADKASIADNAVNSTYAINDDLGRKISDTYSVGTAIEEILIEIKMCMSEDTMNPISREAIDFFTDDEITPFEMNVLAFKKDSNNKQIFSGSLVKQFLGAQRNNYQYIFIKFPDDVLPPKQLRINTDLFGSGYSPTYANIFEGNVEILGESYYKYHIFTSTFDFHHDAYVGIEFIY